jgi:hypothetical protein
VLEGRKADNHVAHHVVGAVKTYNTAHNPMGLTRK